MFQGSEFKKKCVDDLRAVLPDALNCKIQAWPPTEHVNGSEAMEMRPASGLSWLLPLVQGLYLLVASSSRLWLLQPNTINILLPQLL